jgi:hypothetical protein
LYIEILFFIDVRKYLAVKTRDRVNTGDGHFLTSLIYAVGGIELRE